MTFKQLVARLIPANKELNYLDVKEKADVMEAAKAQAEHFYQIYLRAVKEHELAYDHYMEQCQRKRMWKQGV